MMVSNLYEPWTNTTVNQRRTTSPAVWIWVKVLFLLNEFAFFLKAVHDVFITFFYKSTGIIWNSFCKFTFSIDWFNFWNTTACKYLVVIFTKGWCNMNNTSTVICCNVSSIKHAESAFFALLTWFSFTGFWILKVCKIWEQWFVFCAKEIFTLMTVDDFVSFWIFIVSWKTSFCKDIKISWFLVLNLYIIKLWPHTKTKVWRKCPWSCCPCDEICVSVSHFRIIHAFRCLSNLEADSNSHIVYIFISLCKLVCRKNSWTAGTIRKNVFTFIDKAFIPQRFCNPPDWFHVVRVHCLIIMVKVYPTTHTGNCCTPFWSIFKNRCLTFIVEFINSKFFNFMLWVDSQFFFNKIFYRKTMTVPTETAFNLFALHCLVTRNNIFNCWRNEMSKVWKSCCKRRTIKEYVFFTTFTLVYWFFESIIFFPVF